LDGEVITTMTSHKSVQCISLVLIPPQTRIAYRGVLKPHPLLRECIVGVNVGVARYEPRLLLGVGVSVENCSLVPSEAKRFVTKNSGKWHHQTLLTLNKSSYMRMTNSVEQGRRRERVTLLPSLRRESMAEVLFEKT